MPYLLGADEIGMQIVIKGKWTLGVSPPHFANACLVMLISAAF